MANPRIFRSFTAIALPIRPQTARCASQRLAPVSIQCRRSTRASSSNSGEKRPKGPDTDSLPHVSEEAAATAKITGDKGPDIQQGTPVQEVIKGKKELHDKLPKVMQDEKSSTEPPSGTRSFSTVARRQEDLQTLPSTPSSLPPTLIPSSSLPLSTGVKFGTPTLPLPPQTHLKHRDDPIVQQVTTLLMRHGKLSVAQHNMSFILSHLRTAPPPKLNPARPLVAGHPPPHQLPLDPVMYLTLAIDSIGPLVRIRSQKGAAGGGQALQIPVPLRQRQRRRQAVMWILAAAEKRAGKGGTKNMFAQKVADEVVAVVEGRSSVWERRNQLHRIAVSNRSNVGYKKQPGRR
ncbi:ribosomal protein S7 [Eremomyces bilateralis CBS 781.70]|uniref:Small ribosomal subunit protein uS7m n=1 Tax=Eremomyces bilateralis CBS 781.70 TaxID=1392243 RepID=A0A6G1G7P9_9PEZI|nr:ribosomal protein S7 [Eremomyces bilateralis CBS 781.70]KAF1814088.1 ribosomal protein S7 [Eremomyces bilateralis CBS 781.70]